MDLNTYLYAEEICQDFAFGLWRLWKNRNDAVFKGILRHPTEILDDWRKSTCEYRDALSRETIDAVPPRTPKCKIAESMRKQWQKPTFNFIKINTDAAWCKSTLRAGMGWLGRDFAGLLKAAGGSGRSFCHSAAAVEACAIRHALLACIDHGFDQVIIESDAKEIILMLRKEMDYDYSIECILGDIEVIALRLKSVTFTFVPRECNRAAHSVAKYVFKEGSDFIWDYIGPDFLFNTLAQDVNLSIRL